MAIASYTNVRRAKERTSLSQEILVKILEDDWTPAQIAAGVELIEGTECFEFAPGARMIPPDRIGILQRVRLMKGMLGTVAELGWWDTTLDRVLERSGLARTTFYRLQNNTDELWVETLDCVVGCLLARIDTAAREGDNWRDRFQFGLEELLHFAIDEPDAAKALILGACGSGTAGIDCYENLLSQLAESLDSQVRRELEKEPPELAAQGVVGGIFSMLRTRLVKGEFEDFDTLLDRTMAFATVSFA